MKKNETFVEGLCRILAKQGAITESEAKSLKKAFYDRSQDTFDDFLIQEGLLTRPVLLNALSDYYSVPSFDVEGYFFEHHLLREFPREFLVRNKIIPLERDENTLIVIASDPNNEDLLPEIGRIASYDIQFMVGIGQDIIDAIEEFYDTSVTQVSEDDDVDEEHMQEDEAHQIIYPDDDDL